MSDNRYNNNRDDGRARSSRDQQHRRRGGGNGNDDGDGRRHDRPSAAAASSSSPRNAHAVASRSTSNTAKDEPQHDSGKAQQEAERRARMARLRAENEQDERKLAPLLNVDQQHKGKSNNDDDDDDDPANGRTKRKLRDNNTRHPQEAIVPVDERELEGLEEEEQMQLLMGIQGFGSTKGQKVESNHNSSAAGAAAKNKARKYRQYMNRKNGFNRPLDKMD